MLCVHAPLFLLTRPDSPQLSMASTAVCFLILARRPHSRPFRPTYLHTQAQARAWVSLRDPSFN